MKTKLIFSLTLMAFMITACGGGQPTPTPSEPAVPTQAVTQPTPATTTANTVTNATTPATEAAAANVSFANDIMPIFANSCADCHGVKQTKAGLDLRTYQSLMAGSFNGDVIVPGNSADSVLVQMVAKGKMPKRGPKLTPQQIKTISDWINAGAMNN